RSRRVYGVRVELRGGGGRRPSRGGLARGRDRAPQPLTVVWVAQPHDAVGGDLHPLRPLDPEEGPVGTADVLEQPGRALQPEHRMTPRHPGLIDHYVRLWVATDAIGAPCVQAAVGPLGPDD